MGVAVLLAGCPKKPARPSPDQTILGQGPGETIKPVDVGNLGENAAGLENKTGSTDKFDESNLQRGVLPVVYFDFDRSAIKAGERPKLQEAVKWLTATENKDKRLLLEGHCDWRGTAEYNMALGDRRANEVKNYLHKLGIDPIRLEILSKGSLGAREKGSHDEMAKDRRVELVVMKLP